MGKIAQYIGYFLAVVSAVTVIWQKAIITEQRKEKVTQQDKRIESLEGLLVTKGDIANVVDSVIMIRLESLVKSQNALRASHVLLVKDISKSIDGYIKYLNGIEFELKMPVRDTIKIQIRKLK